MQESVTSWDIPSVQPDIGWGTKLYFLFLLAYLLACLWKAFGIWRRIGRNPRSVRRTLNLALQYLRTAAFSELRKLAEAVPEGSPEAGLREWIGLSESSALDSYLKVLRSAQHRFEYRWDRISSTLETLRRLTLLTLIATLLFILHTTINLLLGISVQVHTSTSVLARALSDELVPAEIAVLLSLAVFAAYAFLRARSEQRKSCWKCFHSCAESSYLGTARSTA